MPPNVVAYKNNYTCYERTEGNIDRKIFGPGWCCRTIKEIKPLPVALLSRAVVLESGLETFFYHLGLVLDLLVFGLGLVSDLVIGLAKCSRWSRPSPAIYAFFSLSKPLIWLTCSANG